MFWLTIGMCARISLKLFHVILLNLIISRIQLFYFVWCKKIHHYNTCIELINSERCRSPFRSKQTHCICSLYVTILMRLWCPYQIINCPKQKPFQTSRTQNGARCAIQQIKKKKSQCAKQQHQIVLIVKHCKTVEYVIIIGRVGIGSQMGAGSHRSRQGVDSFATDPALVRGSKTCCAFETSLKDFWRIRFQEVLCILR